jgi:hypothetical protein
MSLVALILLIMFFALVWHDEPVRLPVIERRTNQKRLPYE